MSEPKRPLTAEDLYDLELVTDPQISPDGAHVLFGQIRVDRKAEKKFTNLWIVSTSGEQQPRRFTYGDHTDTHARWSPDGHDIAFLSNRKDSKQMQLYIIPFRGGEARPVTDVKGSFAGYQWSPDGRHIVSQFRLKDAATLEREADEAKKKLGVVARHITSLNYKADGAGYVPDEKWHIWTFATDTGEGAQLTRGDFHETSPRWTPDGRHILFISNRDAQWELNEDETEFYLIPATGGDMAQIETGHHGRKMAPSFSPDGQTLAYLGNARTGHWYQNNVLYMVPLSDGQATNLSQATDLHLGIATLTDTGSGAAQTRPTWSADGQQIYIQATTLGNQPVLAFDVTTAECREVIAGEGAVGSFSLSRDGRQMAYLWGTQTAVGQLWHRSLPEETSRALTALNSRLFDEIVWGELEEVWLDGPEGTRLQGWILKPPGFDPTQSYPSILEIHGGPMTQYGRTFMHEFHFLAAHGYVISFSNPRGSQGYGEAHAGAIANCWGTVDYDDVMVWADYIEKLPYIDAARMGVTGGSYGGYMTALIIGKTNRFKAAVAQRVVSNFLSFYGSSDMNWRTEHLITTETQPWNDFEGYWRQSPISYIGNARTPTLIIHSESDLRCDREQGEQLFVALKRLGVATEMVLFPGESHGLSRMGRTDRRVERLSHMLRWFETYLK